MIEVVTAPTVEPLTLAEAKAHMRVDSTTEDALITAYIAAARAWLENQTGRAIAQQTLREHLDRFPSCRTIRLGRPRARSVTSVKYYDSDNELQTLDAVSYHVDLVSEPARIVLAHDQAWPSTYDRPNAVQIQFEAGYTSVPELDKLAMRLLVAHEFENREPVNVGNIVTEMPLALQTIVQQLSTGAY